MKIKYPICSECQENIIPDEDGYIEANCSGCGVLLWEDIGVLDEIKRWWIGSGKDDGRK